MPSLSTNKRLGIGRRIWTISSLRRMPTAYRQFADPSVRVWRAVVHMSLHPLRGADSVVAVLISDPTNFMA